jgi:FkbM family methyltransferase
MIKKLVRTLQVKLPALRDLKFTTQRVYRSALRIPFEADFRALRLLPDDPSALYLDVGANRGQSTEAIRLYKKAARVAMFEPNPALARGLSHRFSKDPHSVVRPFGLSDREESLPLYIPVYDGWEFEGLASFDRRSASEWLKTQLFGFDDSRLVVREELCSVTTLDSLDLAPFFIKLDVQGYELRALRGGMATLRCHKPILLVETPDSELFQFIQALGYEAFAFREGMFRRGESGRLNTFFMTRDKAALVSGA